MIAAMVRLLPLALLLCLLPRPARAQVPVEVSGGYSLAHDSRDIVLLPAGWAAGAAVAITPIFSAVADVSGQYATITLVDADVKLSVLTAMGGVRASGRLGAFTEFGQILFGVVRTTGSAFGSTATARSFGIQPGVGLDYPLARRWAARGELDIRVIGDQPNANNSGYELRFVAGLVYHVRPR
jgi:hypothetical protein